MGMVDGKICLVTGGASNPGLGHAIAHKLASEGATVIVTDVDGEGAARTAAEIQEAGGQAQAWEQDVTDEAVWASTMAQIRDEHGRLDALVNNAGIAILKTLPELSLADYNRQMLVNMTSVFLGTQKAVALMRETDRIEQHLPFLASVGSTSPYIGLLGTVWGIMHSFRGLANATQATLATVAPGISEALIATAMGLFAAIPAVLAYNRLAARSDVLLNRYETFLDEFSGILQRQTYALKANQSQRP